MHSKSRFIVYKHSGSVLHITNEHPLYRENNKMWNCCVSMLEEIKRLRELRIETKPLYTKQTIPNHTKERLGD